MAGPGGTPAVVGGCGAALSLPLYQVGLHLVADKEAEVQIGGSAPCPRSWGWWVAEPVLRFLFEASPALGPGCEAEVLVAAGHLGGGGDIPHLGGAELSPPQRDALFPTQTTRAAGAILFLFPIFTSPLALFSNSG